MMSLRVACLFVETWAVLSCRDPSQGPPASAPAKSRPHALPEIPDFAGGTEEHGPTYTRRTYARGPESITVTLARFPMSAPQYEGWLRMSTADFPQAALEVRPDEGNGFYQCAPEDASRCDLLVQLRCGIHLEIRGQGIALRQDADAILRGLDLDRKSTSLNSSHAHISYA